MEQVVDIGFVEDCEAWRLESRFFPSKIGGKPAWLDLKNIPNSMSIECKKCQGPCIFLCQIYAPYENDNNAFHRTIFVFICKNYECCQVNDNNNLIVLRSQLPRDNEFYSFDPPEERQDWQQEICADKWTKTCQVCGLAAPSQCSKCKKVQYCSRVHQVFHWKNGHKQICNDANSHVNNTDDFKSLLFPEYELAIEREEATNNDDTDADFNKEKEEIEKYNSLLKSGNAGTLQSEKDVDGDLLKMAATEEDKNFMKFRAKINKHPDQVLRYDRGGSPLYISSENQPDVVPNCEECGGERQFEFQIMPQLLNDLGFDDVLKSLDWGILAIFTCKKSCVPKSGYAREFVWKQDIVDAEKEEK